MNPRMILASQSRERKKLLSDRGLTFEVEPSGYDESSAERLPIEERASYLAYQKAKVVAAKYVGTDSIVIGGDTVVTIHGQSLEKPVDISDATRMLRLLSDNEHRVISGLAVIRNYKNINKDNVTSPLEIVGEGIVRVRFKSLSDFEIDSYLDKDEWQGRAGAYNFLGALPFVRQVSGDPTSIIGLPISLLDEFLVKAGYFYGKKKHTLEI